MTSTNTNINTNAISKLIELLTAATPRPWHVFQGKKFYHIKNFEGRYVVEATKGYGPRLKADAELIVAAVNVLPGLLDEVKRLRAGNTGMTETIEWVPVSEKQPSFGKTVLVCINEYPDATDFGWFDGAHWIGFEDGTFAPGEVTHWAEKPKGPRE